jgi:hypothetical protein
VSIAHGIVVGGRVIPGTERVIRDSSAWWDGTTHDTRPRGRARVRTCRAHWSGGTYREGPSAGEVFVRYMNARENDQGDDLHVSVHHSISGDGLIWQHLDHEIGSVDVGFRPAILDGVSIEVMWPGTLRQATRLGILGRPVVAREWDGVRVDCVRPTDAQIEAWRWLAAQICEIHGIPKRCAPQRRMTAFERARWVRSGGGVEEHGSMPGTTKVDACGLLMEATGYPSAAPPLP